MPRPRLSYEQAKLNGSVAINKGRFASRKNAPTTTGSLGTPPKHLDEAAKKVWREIVKSIPAGVAGASDRITVEMASTLLAQFRAAPATMQASRVALLLNLLGRLGLDPQARTKLQIETTPPTEKKDDKWSSISTTPPAQRDTRVM